MKPFWTIVIMILGLIYIISPIDGLPDMIPFLGWLDDTFLMGLLIYYLRYRRLPGFILRLGQVLFQTGGHSRGDAGQSASHPGNEEKTQAGTEPNPKSPWEILGIAPGASPEEIHHAYRKAAQQYHPDKVSHLGDEFRELAQQKFIEIQEAYTLLTGK